MYLCVLRSKDRILNSQNLPLIGVYRNLKQIKMLKRPTSKIKISIKLKGYESYLIC
jgi:hypothetical protein